MNYWRCTVCNYIHTGNQPPEKCPVCGADKTKFVEITGQEAEKIESAKTDRQVERERQALGKAGGNEEAGPEGAEDREPVGKGISTRLAQFNLLMLKHHAHPVSVHIPNGVLPVSVLFVLIASLFSAGAVATAAFYNSVMVLVSMPLVLYSGYNAWQLKYGGNLSRLFIAKMAAAAVVTLTCLLVVIWYLADPAILVPGSAGRAGFIVLNLVMLASAVVAGLIGGKLVFGD